MLKLFLFAFHNNNINGLNITCYTCEQYGWITTKYHIMLSYLLFENVNLIIVLLIIILKEAI